MLSTANTYSLRDILDPSRSGFLRTVDSRSLLLPSSKLSKKLTTETTTKTFGLATITNSETSPVPQSSTKSLTSLLSVTTASPASSTSLPPSGLSQGVAGEEVLESVSSSKIGASEVTITSAVNEVQISYKEPSLTESASDGNGLPGSSNENILSTRDKSRPSAVNYTTKTVTSIFLKETPGLTITSELSNANLDNNDNEITTPTLTYVSSENNSATHEFKELSNDDKSSSRDILDRSRSLSTRSVDALSSLLPSVTMSENTKMQEIIKTSVLPTHPVPQSSTTLSSATTAVPKPSSRSLTHLPSTAVSGDKIGNISNSTTAVREGAVTINNAVDKVTMLYKEPSLYNDEELRESRTENPLISRYNLGSSKFDFKTRTFTIFSTRKNAGSTMIPKFSNANLKSDDNEVTTSTNRSVGSGITSKTDDLKEFLATNTFSSRGLMDSSRTLSTRSVSALSPLVPSTTLSKTSTAQTTTKTSILATIIFSETNSVLQSSVMSSTALSSATTGVPSSSSTSTVGLTPLPSPELLPADSEDKLVTAVSNSITDVTEVTITSGVIATLELKPITTDNQNTDASLPIGIMA